MLPYSHPESNFALLLPPFQPNDFLEPNPDYPDQDLNGLDRDLFVLRRHRTTDSYTKIHNLLAGLRRERISPVDILLQVLDPDDLSYDRYRGNLYRDDNTKLASLIEIIMSDQNGKQKLSQCMGPHLLDLACDTVAEEMETRRKNSILPGIEAITPAFMENGRRYFENRGGKTQVIDTATFKKKTMAMIAGHGFADDEEDECPIMAYVSTLPDDYS
jgi:hypothetical protein